MTLTKKDFNKIYQRLYSEAEKAINQYNPCEIDNCGICIRTRSHRECGRGGRYDRYNCCGGITYNVHSPDKCKYLTDKGCSVESLGCKLAFCGEIPDFPKELRNKIDCLAGEFKDMTGSKVGVWDIIRKSREETLTYLLDIGVIEEEE